MPTYTPNESNKVCEKSLYGEDQVQQLWDVANNEALVPLKGSMNLANPQDGEKSSKDMPYLAIGPNQMVNCIITQKVLDAPMI